MSKRARDGGEEREAKRRAEETSTLVALVTKGVLEALAQRERDREEAGPSQQRRVMPDGRRVRCWRCCGTGHMARDCTNDVRCYRCQGWGHRAPDCATPAPVSGLRRKISGKKGGQSKGAKTGQQKVVQAAKNAALARNAQQQQQQQQQQ
jgi:hypothetical protein